MTYYKYQERSVDSQINWADVGKSMSDMLNTEAETREAKKSAIDEASRQFGEVLANAPVGDYDAGNTFALTFANDAQEYRKMQDTLLKSGQLSLKDYTIGRQNINDGTNNMFNLSKEYQAEYTRKMARWEGDESSFREVWDMQQAEGLANLRDAKGYINPTNGVVNVGKMVMNDKGVYEMSTNPNDFAQVNQLRARMKMEYNRYNLNEQAAKKVAFLGDIEEEVIKYAGEGSLNTIITMIDAKQGNYNIDSDAKDFVAGYKEWEKLQVSAIMSVPTHVESILMDTKVTAPNGERYTFTYDKEERDKHNNLVFLDTSKDANGIPEFTKEQKEIVTRLTQVAIRGQIDVKKKVKSAGTTPYKPKYIGDEGKADVSNLNAVNNLGELYYGDASQLESSANFLLGFINQGVKEDTKRAVELDRNDDGVTIHYANGDSRTFSFMDSQGKKIAQDDWIKGAVSEFTNIDDVDKALKNSSYIRGKELTTGQATAKYNIPAKTSASASLNKYLDDSNFVFEGGSDSWNTTYGPRLANLGYTVERDGSRQVKISRGEKQHIISTKVNDAAGRERELDNLFGFIRSTLNKQERAALIQDGVLPYTPKDDEEWSDCVNGVKTEKETGATVKC